MSDLPLPADFQLLFEATPHPYLVLRPDENFTIAAVNKRYLAITGTQRSAIVGRGVFEVFPDSLDNDSGKGLSDLRTSLNRVLAERCQDVMGVQRYDLPRRGGSGEFETKYWSPVNTPVFGPAGNLLFITHHVEDITEFVLNQNGANQERAWQIKPGEARAERSEAEVLRRASEVKEANRALKTAKEEVERREAELTHLKALLEEQDRVKDASLVKALHWLDAHLNNSPLAIIEFDPVFTVTRWSETAEHLFGWRADEIVGRPVAEIRWVHEEDREAVNRIVAGMLSGTAPRNRISHRNYRKDGSVVHCEWYNSAIYDGAGNLVSILSQVLDVTEQRAAEKALLESEGKFRTIADAIPQIVWSTLPDGFHDYYNRQWYEFTGVPVGSTDGEGWNGMFHPEDQPRAWEIWRHSLATGEPYEIEYRLRHHSGTYRWVLGRALPIRDESGAIVRWMGTCTDIDEHKRAHEALQESEARFRLMADAAPVMIWVAGFDGLCTWFNEHWLDFTGRTLHEEIGNGWSEGIHPEDSERCLKVYELAFERREVFTMEYRLRRHDGKYRWIIDHGVPRLEADGRFAGYIGTCIDVTEEKGAKEALLGLNDQLENRVQLRTQELEQSHEALVRSNIELQRFAYIAAHDLQTPLRSIASFTQLAMMRLKDQLDAETTEFMQLVSANTKRMQALINDLLAYSRLDAQAHPFEETDMGHLFNEVVSGLAGTIEESGAKVTCEELPTLRVDRTQIAQVFTNLIENGIKYNRSKQIEIQVSAKHENDGWVFAVRDNGIGIDSRHQAQIFAAFKRLHAYHDYPGSGVGLAICQRVVERHGGRIWVESEVGHGSVFYFTLEVVAARHEGLHMSANR